jgi:hypothetical protein
VAAHGLADGTGPPSGALVGSEKAYRAGRRSGPRGTPSEGGWEADVQCPPADLASCGGVVSTTPRYGSC